jgi:hypothetical protein
VTFTEDQAADLILEGNAFRSVKEPGSWRVRVCLWRPVDVGTERAGPEDAAVLERVAMTLGFPSRTSHAEGGEGGI